jgi:hypothetical protein
MIRRLLAILALALVAPLAGDDRIVAASADYEAVKASGTDDYLYVRYLIVSPEEGIEAPVHWQRALAFTLASASLEVNLNRQLPIAIAPGVYRVDLRGLGWDTHDLMEVLKTEGYPYGHEKNPLYIRGDWLIYQLGDSSESVAYETLLFGKDGRPKNRDEWLAKLGVDVAQVEKLELEHGLIEGRSGVAVQSGASGNKIRVLKFYDRLGGYASGTLDFLKITPENSPLEHPDLKGIKHDGEEWIVGVTKSWSRDPAYDIKTTGRGALQFYFLTNGDGGNVTEAPLKLVEDHSKFKGIASIRTPGSCISCHTTGLNAPTVNLLQSWIEGGIELKAKDYDAQQFIERFHLGGVSTEIERANEDFAATINAACSCKPPEAVAAYVAANDWYRADVTLETAAMELGCTPEELRNALAYASEAGVDVGGHLSALAHGEPVGRFTWEGLYLKAVDYLAAWRHA